MTQPKYSKWDPNKVHMLNGHPIIYNKADNPITQYEAERQFKKAVNTMHTWASRAFKLSAAQTDPELREWELEHLEWELDNIGVWLGAMREAMEEVRGKQRQQDKIDKLLALAESTTFPGEADTARLMAERQRKKAAEG